jgi:hypothetical protein
LRSGRTASTLTNLGLLLSSRGRPADTVTRFRAALAIDGANAQALSGLAWIGDRIGSRIARRIRGGLCTAARLRVAACAAFAALAAAYASAGRFGRPSRRPDRESTSQFPGQQDAAAQFSTSPPALPIAKAISNVIQRFGSDL